MERIRSKEVPKVPKVPEVPKVPGVLEVIEVLMKKLMLLAVVLACAAPAFAQGKLNVMTTTEDLASIAREVGGDRINVDAIAKGYQDPHFVEAKPSFILKLQKADLLIAVGRE